MSYLLTRRTLRPQVIPINDSLNPTKNKSFTYDSLDRLSTAASSGIWGNLGWTYDGVGNRLTENSNSYTYTPNTNKLSSANGLSYGFDNNGNTTGQGAWTYTYNQNQRLIQANNGSTNAYYTYNGNGQRVKKNVNGTTTVFHYSLSGQIIAESDSSGNTTAEYVYLNGQPLAMVVGTNTYYYHNDHLGTPQKMTDSSGAVVWAADYKPFGEAAVTVSTITNNLRFPGQYYDAETGTHYNYYRDYNPSIGRYIEKDPIGLKGGVNVYSYSNLNPVNLTDERGLWLDPPDIRADEWIEGDLTDQFFVYNPLTNLGSLFLPGPCDASRDGQNAKVRRTYSLPGVLPDNITTSYNPTTYSVKNDRYERLRTVKSEYYAIVTYGIYKCKCNEWKFLGDYKEKRLFKTETSTYRDWWLGIDAPPPDPFMI